MDNNVTRQAKYRFRDVSINTGKRTVSRDGEIISVEPKVYDLIVYLLENSDRAVDKNKLQDNIWPGLVVTEASLTRCIMKARRALDDVARPHQVIETVQRIGSINHLFQSSRKYQLPPLGAELNLNGSCIIQIPVVTAPESSPASPQSLNSRTAAKSSPGPTAPGH